MVSNGSEIRTWALFTSLAVSGAAVGALGCSGACRDNPVRSFWWLPLGMSWGAEELEPLTALDIGLGGSGLDGV